MFVKSMLSGIRFVCPNRNNQEKVCNEIDKNGVLYNEAITHLNECKSNKYKCPLKCHVKFPDDPKTIFQASAPEIKDHIQGKCPCYMEKCPKCMAKYTQADKENHVCISYLKEKRVNEVMELFKWNEEMGTDYYKLKLKCNK